MTEAVSGITAELVAYAAGARDQVLPAAVTKAARMHILDTLAAIVSGSLLPGGRAGQQYAAGGQGEQTASILGTAMSGDLVGATIANGMAGHANESDDSHETSKIHPGCAIVPAALAVGEIRGSSGIEFERAVVLGYDIGARFGETFCGSMSPFRSSLATHSYGPVFGAGFAAGSLHKFDGDRFVTLLSYLAQEASGITTWALDERHVLKSYVFGGMPAGNGVRAARFVELGFSGSGDVLHTDRRNMLAALGVESHKDLLIDRLGERFIMLESDIKSHPIGYPVIAPVAVVEALLANNTIDVSQIVELRVRYDEDWYTVVGTSSMPDINLPYCLAATLLDDRLTFAAAHDDDRMSSPEIRAISDKIKLLGPVPHLDKFDVRVEIDLGDRVIAGEQVGDGLGRAGNPMSKSQVETKATELISTVLGSSQAAVVIDMVDRLDEVADVRDLIGQLRPRESQ